MLQLSISGKHRLLHPTRIVPLLFLLAIGLGTLLLRLPAATVSEQSAPWLTALFTASSAVCVTGLVVVDTAQYWSSFGQWVILLLFQIGGFGLMTGATVLGVLVSRQLGLGRRLALQRETPALSLGEFGTILKLVLGVTLMVELLVTSALALRLATVYQYPWPEALWHGFFHAVSAFNNAGFSTWSDSLMGFAGDPLFLGAIMLAILLGGLGFPVLHELARWRRASHGRGLSLQSRLTLWGTGALLLFGFLACLAYEWSNPATLGGMTTGERLLGALFHSVTTRTAGFNALDVGALQTESLAFTYLLMFIGGGSASTAGGIKVTSFFLIGFIVWAEIRNNPDTSLYRRRVTLAVQRQALAVVFLMASLIALGTQALLSLTDLPLEDVFFEVVSASSTVGLSTGITGDLPPAAQGVLILLMYCGRLGPVTVAAALALRGSRKRFRLPREELIVG